MIEALSHITFIVSDLERMSNFLTTIFNAEEIYSSDGKEFSIAREKFFVINDVWIAIMEGDPVSQKSYNHVAFRVAESDFDTCLNRIEALGVDVLKGRNRIEGEGKSVYFYDYDNHLFEIHTGTLNKRLKSYQKSEI